MKNEADMKRPVLYVGYMDTPQSKHAHFVSPAGSSKMEYVAEVISASHCQVEVLSMARPIGEAFKCCKSEVVEISPHVHIRFSPFIISENLLIRKWCAIWQLFRLFLFFLLSIKKTDTIVVYHSLSYASLFYLLKKMKGFRLILEVEEIYHDVKQIYGFNSWIEKRLFQTADAYIFPTEMLDQKVNRQGKPSMIIYGNYHVPSVSKEKMTDGKTHVIYAGTFDERKGGALSTIRSAAYLDNTYVIHITGHGSDRDVERVRQEIDEVSQKTSCSISYDGFVADEDFLSYIQQFHIGLCTQDPNDSLSSSCFPSKILMYMSNGLTVLSSKAPAVVNSHIAPELYFYESQDPVCIADMLRKIPSNVDKRPVIKDLDAQCKIQMRDFLSVYSN